LPLIQLRSRINQATIATPMMTSTVRGRIHHNRRAPARVLTGGRTSWLRVSGRRLDRRNRGPAWRPAQGGGAKERRSPCSCCSSPPHSSAQSRPAPRAALEGRLRRLIQARQAFKTRTPLGRSFHMLASTSLRALLARASPSDTKSTSSMLRSNGRITLKR
jgi:hypothetical protein